MYALELVVKGIQQVVITLPPFMIACYTHYFWDSSFSSFVFLEIIFVYDIHWKKIDYFGELHIILHRH